MASWLAMDLAVSFGSGYTVTRCLAGALSLTGVFAILDFVYVFPD